MFVTGDIQFVRNDPASGGSNAFLKTEEEFRNKLAELRIEQDKMKRRKSLMEQRKNEIVDELKEKGINSSSDISDKDILYKINNLQTAVADIGDVEKNISRYQEGINAIEAMLTKLEQERISNEVAISEEKAKELSMMLIDLDEKLIKDNNILEEEALRELLGSELGE